MLRTGPPVIDPQFKSVDLTSAVSVMSSNESFSARGWSTWRLVDARVLSLKPFQGFILPAGYSDACNGGGTLGRSVALPKVVHLAIDARCVHS